MKTLLAVNTTGGRCSVAVGSSQLILAESNLAAERGHSEILIPMIEETLHKSRTTLNELAGFLVCSGPGNYTSLRIAISAIRGFALAIKKPAIGISMFELLAEKEKNCLVIVQGPMGKVYIQKFCDTDKISDPKLVIFEDLLTNKTLCKFFIVGFQAAKVSNAIGSIGYTENTNISFKKFLSLGQSRLSLDNLRPSPLYIK